MHICLFLGQQMKQGLNIADFIPGNVSPIIRKSIWVGSYIEFFVKVYEKHFRDTYVVLT